MHMQDATALKGDRMIVQWMRDVTDIAELRRLSDGVLLATVAEGMPGTMSGIYTEPQRASTEFWFSKETFLEPPAIYSCESGSVETSKAPSRTPPSVSYSITPALGIFILPGSLFHGPSSISRPFSCVLSCVVNPHAV
jgi:hypothetical protein